MLPSDDLEALAAEVRKQIQSNNNFLERVLDEDYDDEDGVGDEEPVADEDIEEFEEL
ncbi:hypothetical protein GMSM_36140 [Geomonas sp. Red276]